MTDRQHKAIYALVSGDTITDAAEKAGVSRKTVHTWLTEKEFLSTLATIRAELAATRQHHERQTEALAAIREDLAREREAARRREEELTARLAALQEELRRPWWKRLLRGKR